MSNLLLEGTNPALLNRVDFDSVIVMLYGIWVDLEQVSLLCTMYGMFTS